MVLSRVKLEAVSLSLDHDILHELDCTFEPGITCLLGPNGAGKTLTNRLLSLIQQVTSGRISWDNIIVNPLPNHYLELIRSIGFMHQQPVFVSKSVRANLELPLKFRSVSDLEIKVDKALEEFDLTDFADRHITKLSKGQQQRVALARSLITDPQLLILDEPTASLDMKTTKWFESYLKQLRDKTSKIIIWTTHDHFQVKRVADQVAVILDGRIKAFGTLSSVFEHSTDEEVQLYLQGELV